MQLPFKNLERLGGLQDCTQPEGRCDNPSSHNYTLSLSVWATTSPVFISVLAKTPEFTFDGYLTPFATSSLLRSATGIYHFKNLKLIQTLVRNGRTLSLYEGGVGFFYEWEDDPPQLRTILIPLKKSVFPVAVVILNEQEVRPAIIAEIFRSTSFLP
jgi:hypothetical protein